MSLLNLLITILWQISQGQHPNMVNLLHGAYCHNLEHYHHYRQPLLLKTWHTKCILGMVLTYSTYITLFDICINTKLCTKLCLSSQQNMEGTTLNEH